MTIRTHAVVWIDSDEAKILCVDPDSVDEIMVGPSLPHRHILSKAGLHKGNQAIPRHVFFQTIANQLSSISSFVVVGRTQTKADFIKHMQLYEPRLIPRLAAIEAMDDLSDDRLADLARRHFKPGGHVVPHSAGT